MLRRKIENSKTAFRAAMVALILAAGASWFIRPTGDFAAGFVNGVRIGLYIVALVMVWHSRKLAQRA
ncbi:MAG TPA: hypothetical protein VM099_14635 [Gemmatimonadaceae bacterium]|nr:hypothetical protein [Gemmatimonadaceae bacterium]